MIKTCSKINTAFNYTKTVEQTYTRSTLVKGYPHDKTKKLMTVAKKSNLKTKI